MNTENKERLKELINDMCFDEHIDGDINPETKFQDDLGWDSLDVVEFTINIEREFDIQIDDSKVEKMKTVGDAISYIDELTK